MHNTVELIGLYGGHSKISKDTASVRQVWHSMRSKGMAQKPLWLCGHFAAKAFAQMTLELRKDRSKSTYFATKLLFSSWNERRVEVLKTCQMAAKWQGKAHSILRQGKVNTDRGDVGHRHLMTQVVDSNTDPLS